VPARPDEVPASNNQKITQKQALTTGMWIFRQRYPLFSASHRLPKAQLFRGGTANECIDRRAEDITFGVQARCLSWCSKAGEGRVMGEEIRPASDGGQFAASGIAGATAGAPP